MKTLQTEIDRMYDGNFDAILSNISSKNEYLVMNAILCGTKRKIKNDEFIAGVKKAQDSETVLLGYPLKSVAEASLLFLTDKEYDGDDELVKSLIKNKFDI